MSAKEEARPSSPAKFAAKALSLLRGKSPAPRWPDAEQSLGESITSTVELKSRVWVAKGPALEIFETDIRPRIIAHLANMDVQQEEEPVFLRLYMMGKSPEMAQPTVMVCCVNKAVRLAWRDTIERSCLLGDYPGFCLGHSPKMLEAPSLAGLIMGRGSALEVANPDDLGGNGSGSVGAEGSSGGTQPTRVVQ
ncbi:hypothetical protein B0T19DRAFT_473508 [Cercophora scortea]|uniref:Uncharacterized protein n=1 Tax=Cercophora scortea TaxID=314031 RepID=A0AAE0IWS9_9PEZI|nr:hypothetical protein B0T19DRAFT_473508 [Cercophora scortea]